MMYESVELINSASNSGVTNMIFAEDEESESKAAAQSGGDLNSHNHQHRRMT